MRKKPEKIKRWGRLANAWPLPLWVLGALFCLSALGWAAGQAQPWLLRQGELLLYDANAHHIIRSPAPRITLVVVGERSLATLGVWPFPRARHAELLDRMRLARVVGMDFLFPEASPQDEMLAKAMQAHGRVVLAAHTAPLDDTPGAGQFAVMPAAPLLQAAADIGFTNVDKDVDGLIRFARTIRSGGGEMLPSLALAVARQALQEEGEIRRDGDNFLLVFSTHSLHLDSMAQLWFIPSLKGPPSYEYVDVLDGRVPQEAFKDSVVLVGAAASGAADFQIVPQAFGSRVMSGVRFNAEELRALLTGDAVRIVPPWLNGLAAGLLTLGGGIIMGLARPRRSSPLVACLGAVWLLIAWYLLARHRVWIGALVPLLGAISGGILVLLARLAFLHETWRTQYITLDSIVYLDADEAQRHQTLAAYLEALWARVESETGIRFLGGPMKRDELPQEFHREDKGRERVLIIPAGKSFRRMAVPLIAGGETTYALFGWRRRLSDDSARAAAALAISAAWFFRVQEEGKRRRRMLTDTIKAVFTALDYRDPTTGGHSTRVAELCLRIMEHLDLPPQLYEDIHLGALIHDLGKIGIPDSILNKAESLNRDEYQTIRNHPNIAQSILSTVELPQAAFDAVFHHHERFDGSGYPLGLSGDQISLAGRIVAVADVFDAMSHNRPYRRGQDLDEVLKFMKQLEGSHFDPEIMQAFLRLFPQAGEKAKKSEEESHEAQ